MQPRVIARILITISVIATVTSVFAACGGSSSTPAPTLGASGPGSTATAISIPDATLAPTPTPTPTPIPLEAISGQHLSGMVLDQAEVDREFSGFQKRDRGGHFDENAVAMHTLDPSNPRLIETSRGFGYRYRKPAE